MNARENYLRTVRFENPDYIPMCFHINDACWQYYPQEFLFEMMESHSFLFPYFQRPEGVFKPIFSPVARRDKPYRDDFGCLWHTTEDGITGTVTGHPLKDWKSFYKYQIPDPRVCTGIGPIDWKEFSRKTTEKRLAGQITMVSLRHGHTFLQLCDIRGYENLLYDMIDDVPELSLLIEKIADFNLYHIRQFVDAECDIIGFPEDLGMQNGPMISPRLFRKYIKPVYQKLMQPVREKGLIVHMHSDGHLHDLIDDIIEGGVDVINLQDLVNGVDWIAARFSGRTCVDLDIDRQSIVYHGSPAQVDELIRYEVSSIGRREGGLMMIYGLYPGVPQANIRALMDAMERYAFYFR